MNLEWVLSLISGVLTAVVSYWLGLKKSKEGILREHVSKVAREEYPALYSEMKRNTKRLDNFPKRPEELIEFKRLNKYYQRGLIGLTEKHHNDLFLNIDHFRKNLLPRFDALSELRRDTKERIFQSWVSYLRSSLYRGIDMGIEFGERIASELIMTVNPNYVLPDLLKGRYGAVRKKIGDCIQNRTPPHIYPDIDIEETSRRLIDMAKLEVEKLSEFYNKLREENDKTVKEKILPLLQKYIEKPV